MAYTEGSKIQGPGRNLYTQKFRAQVRILVVGVYSILEFFGAGKAPDLERIQKARKVRARAESVYSNFQDPGQDLSRWRIQYTRIFQGREGSRSGAYTKSSKSPDLGRICILEFFGLGQAPGPERIQDTRKNWARAESVYSKIQCPDRFRVWSVYKILEKTGPGQNLYTQKFSARTDSGSGAYTRYSKKLGLGRICILKNSVPGQVPGLERIQKARKARAESVYSNFQGSDRFRVWSVYKILEKTGPGQNLYTQKFSARTGSWSLAYTVYSNFSGQGRLPIWSVYNILEKSGPGQNLYTQIFRARAGSWSGAYTKSSKSPGPGRICILKFSGLGQAPGPERIQDTRKNWPWAESVYSNFSGAGQAPDLGRIQKAREVRAQIDSCSLTYTAYSKSQDPGEPDSYHIEYTALALHYKHQSSAQTRKRKLIVSTRRV